tara:strand:+ start:473 stop:1744 length:1272 start_codon:yes stop_codon:yes gene_type:complete
MKNVEMQALKEYLLKNGRDKSYNELATDFNIKDKSGNLSGEKVRGVWRRLKIDRVPDDTKIKIIEENGNTYIEHSSKEITSLEDLVDAAGVNIDFWDVKSFRVSTWQDFKDETKYAVRATFDQSSQVRSKIREEFIESAKKHAPKYKAVTYSSPKDKESIAYEINLPDLHLGKLGWGEEVGESYNVDIAKTLFTTAVDKLLAMASIFHIEKIIFPIGNDLLNSEGLSMATTKGTPQHDDVRWQSSFTLCRQMLVEVIDKLRLVAPVDVIIVPGNHDYERMFYIGDAIYSWYHNCEEVEVDNRPSPRKYIGYGKTLIGFTHGNSEKHADLPLIMAKEKPQEWAKAEYTEWHTGHLHKSKSLNWVDIDERFGTIVRILPSLSGTDSWHHEKGYIGNIRSAQAYAWSKEYGYRAQFQVNLKEIKNG